MWGGRLQGRGRAARARSGRAAPAPSLVADTDYVTALCSQVVYEGLVDDTFRIKCGRSPGEATGRCGAAHLRRESPQGLCLLLSDREPACCSQSRSPRGQSRCGVLLEALHKDSPWSDRAAGWASPLSAAFCSRGHTCRDVASAGAKQLFILFAGSVDFGPDVTSSDKSIKVLLNAQDKVSPAHVLWEKRVPLCSGGTRRG